MKKNKFIKCTGTVLGLLGATMSLSYGEINPKKYLEGKKFFCQQEEIKGSYDPYVVKQFLKREKANIEHIEIDNCRLEYGFFGDFPGVLKDNTTLKVLKVKKAYLGRGDVTGIAEALKGNETLKVLHLWTNAIGPSGAGELAEALGNTTLEDLDLHDNNIQDDGAKALAKALIFNETLKSLYLRYTQIGDEGAKALAKALEFNKTLKYLDLSRNQIGDECKQALKDAWVKTRGTANGLILDD